MNLSKQLGTILSILFLSLAFTQSLSAQLKAEHLIVMVTSEFSSGNELGAGIIFGHESHRVYIATASHVVRDDLSVAKAIQVKFKAMPGQHFSATLSDYDSTDLDLAILIVENVMLEAIAPPFQLLGDPSSLDRGDQLRTIGQDAGRLWESPVTPIYYRDERLGQLMSESSVNTRGASGGGLFSDSWLLLGMITSSDNGILRAISVDVLLAELSNNGYPVRLALSPEKPITDKSVDGDPLKLPRSANELQINIYTTEGGIAKNLLADYLQRQGLTVYPSNEVVCPAATDIVEADVIVCADVHLVSRPSSIGNGLTTTLAQVSVEAVTSQTRTLIATRTSSSRPVASSLPTLAADEAITEAINRLLEPFTTDLISSLATFLE